MKRIMIDALVALGLFILLLQTYTELKAELSFRAGDRFANSNQLDLAIVKYREALLFTPDRFEILRKLGQVSLRNYDPAGRNLRPLFIAQSALNLAVELNPLYPYGWHELGEVSFRLRQAQAPDVPNPEQYFRRALEIDPYNPPLLAGNMLWQLDDGRRVEAWDTFLVLIDSYPAAINIYGDRIIPTDSDVSRLEHEIKNRGPQTVQLARLLYRRGNSVRAEELIRGLAADEQARPEAVSLLASALRQQGRMEEAEKVLRQALLREPENCNLIRDLGVVLVFAKKKEAALELFTRQIEARPEDVGLRLEAARAARNLQEWEQAGDWYDSVLTSGKLAEAQTRESLLGLAEVRHQQGKLRAALIAYRQLLDLDPGNRKLRENIDQLQLELERQAQTAE